MALDLAALAQILKGEIVTPADAGYAQAIARWASNAERRAQIVALVKDHEDVVTALKFARENGLSVAVRGGGHNVGGASSIEGGLVIDLNRHMNGVTVDAAKKLGYVGGGAIWETVDVECIKHGLATVGGTVNHTGVGGLVLGGGYGWLTGAHGLAIDNLVQAIVVTADGSILTANKDQNQDLFFAIRGAGGNFGVITEFVLQLHPQRPTVYGGLLIYPASALENIVQATNTWWSNVSKDEGMLQICTVSPEGAPVIVLCIFFNGPEAEGRQRFKSFLDIGPLADLTGDLPYEKLNALQNPAAKHGRAVYWKGVANKNPHFSYIGKAYDKAVEAIKTGNFQGGVLYEYFPLDKVNAVPRSATAFRREMVNNVLINISWDGQAGDHTEEARTLSHEIADIINSAQSDMTVSESAGYSNYDPEAQTQSKAVQDKAKIVFGENYSKLQTIKKRYDPDNIFNKWFAILPAP